jgi:FkbM family methyltransferase
MIMNNDILKFLRKITIAMRVVPGAVIFLDLIRRKLYATRRSIVIDDFDGDISIDLALHEHMQSQIFWYGYYNRDIVLLIKKILCPKMVAVDLGSNIGEITLVCAKHVGTSGRVIAFEPMPAMTECLLANVDRNNFSNVVVEKKGIADTIGVVDIFRAPNKGHDGAINEGLGTLYSTAKRSELVEQINITTLDNYFSEHPVSRLDLIKIDIEGAELAALHGAINTIKMFRPYLIVEVQEESAKTAGYDQKDILSFLSSLDYKFYIIERNGRLNTLEEDGLKCFQNVLCVPTEKPLPATD